MFQTPRPASRLLRLIAYIIDFVLLMGFIVLTGYLSGFQTVLASIAFAAMYGVNLINPTQVALVVGLLSLTIAIYIIIQSYLLTTRGQTLGKILCHIHLEHVVSGDRRGFIQNVILRTLLGHILLGMIPFYGIVDVCYIFRKNRRCVHDLIADTVVVQGI